MTEAGRRHYHRVDQTVTAGADSLINVAGRDLFNVQGSLDLCQCGRTATGRCLGRCARLLCDIHQSPALPTFGQTSYKRDIVANHVRLIIASGLHCQQCLTEEVQILAEQIPERPSPVLNVANALSIGRRYGEQDFTPEVTKAFQAQAAARFIADPEFAGSLGALVGERLTYRVATHTSTRGAFQFTPRGGNPPGYDEWVVDPDGRFTLLAVRRRWGRPRETTSQLPRTVEVFEALAEAYNMKF